MQARLIGRRSFFQSCGAAAGVTLCCCGFAQKKDAGFDELLTAIPGAMEREGVPGLQIAVIRDGEIALFKSFGVVNAETRDAVSNETVFEAASLSKPVFAYLVMKLAEDGVIDLDAPLYTIEKPPADGPVELVEAITAKMVLSHTTGFPNWHISGKPLTLGRSQGTQFSYSGMAYVYLQRVIEKKTGKTLDVLLQERVFTPFGMASASMVARDDYEKWQTFGHGKNGKPARFPVRTANAASSLVCTAEDYARFATALLKPPPADKFYLKPESVQQMLTPRVVVAPNVQWGLGVALEMPDAAPPLFFQWGNNNDANTSFVDGCPASGDGVVIMTNSGTGLRVCREVLPLAVPGGHPVLKWRRIFHA